MGYPRYDDQVTGADQPLRAFVAWRACCLAGMFACVAPPAGFAEGGQPGRGSGQAIVIRAAEAWESEDGNILYVRGDLSLHAPDWHLSAEQGRIEGRIEDPDLIAVSGSPARIFVQRPRDEEAFEGTGERLEFRPRVDAVKLRGDALVIKGQQSIRSSAIDYALKRDTFSAGLSGRVRVVTTPRDAANR